MVQSVMWLLIHADLIHSYIHIHPHISMFYSMFVHINTQTQAGGLGSSTAAFLQDVKSIVHPYG